MTCLLLGHLEGIHLVFVFFSSHSMVSIAARSGIISDSFAFSALVVSLFITNAIPAAFTRDPCDYMTVSLLSNKGLICFMKSSVRCAS